MVQVYRNTDPWFQKAHKEFRQLHTSSEKFKKLQSYVLHSYKKTHSVS